MLEERMAELNRTNSRKVKTELNYSCICAAIEAIEEYLDEGSTGLHITSHVNYHDEEYAVTKDLKFYSLWKIGCALQRVKESFGRY